MQELMPPVTRDLAEFAVGVGRNDIPLQVVQFLKDDFAAMALSAGRSRARTEVKNASATLHQLGGTAACSIMFRDLSADPVRAALQSGILFGGSDRADSEMAGTQLTAAIWSAGLSAAQFKKADGKRLIVAVSVGWEVALRLRRGLGPNHEARGFSSVATCGTFGAAVSAALLLGLDRGGLLDVLGLVASYAGGLSAAPGVTLDDGLATGLAAAAGVEVAFLARAGLTGPRDAIEGDQGFGRAVSDTFDARIVVDRLGVDWFVQAPASEPSRVTEVNESLRTFLADLHPNFDADAWLARLSTLDEVGSASELLI
jgi:2-methylcitrate dehydratase PrpD